MIRLTPKQPHPPVAEEPLLSVPDEELPKIGAKYEPKLKPIDEGSG